MKSVASVTMNDGSWVRTTVKPFRKPMSRQSRTVPATAGQTDQPNSVVSSITDMPETPTIEPTERSNSPPIIRSATPTARIPSGAAAFRYDAVPRHAPERRSGRARKEDPDEDGAHCRRDFGTGEDAGRAPTHRRPRLVRSMTCCAVSIVTKPGPVGIACPPPGTVPVSRYSVSRTTGR